MSAAEQVTPPASNSRSLIERAWPLAGLGLALVTNAVWIGFLAIGLVVWCSSGDRMIVSALASMQGVGN